MYEETEAQRFNNFPKITQHWIAEFDFEPQSSALLKGLFVSVFLWLFSILEFISHVTVHELCLGEDIIFKKSYK